MDAVVTSDGKYFCRQYSGFGVVGDYAISAHGKTTTISGGDDGDLPTVGAEGLAWF